MEYQIEANCLEFAFAVTRKTVYILFAVVITEPMPQWFSGSPPVSCILLPIPDPDLYWGSMSCSKCTSFCSGHFLTPENNGKENKCTRDKNECVQCGFCQGIYKDVTVEVEKWTACDKCDNWNHFQCTGLDIEPYQNSLSEKHPNFKVNKCLQAHKFVFI